MARKGWNPVYRIASLITAQRSESSAGQLSIPPPRNLKFFKNNLRL